MIKTSFSIYLKKTAWDKQNWQWQALWDSKIIQVRVQNLQILNVKLEMRNLRNVYMYCNYKGYRGRDSDSLSLG